MTVSKRQLTDIRAPIIVMFTLEGNYDDVVRIIAIKQHQTKLRLAIKDILLGEKIN